MEHCLALLVRYSDFTSDWDKRYSSSVCVNYVNCICCNMCRVFNMLEKLKSARDYHANMSIIIRGRIFFRVHFRMGHRQEPEYPNDSCLSTGWYAWAPFYMCDFIWYIYFIDFCTYFIMLFNGGTSVPSVTDCRICGSPINQGALRVTEWVTLLRLLFGV